VMRQFRARREDGDSGFTLVELTIYSILLLVVMAIAGAIFIGLLRGQREVTQYGHANNTAQTVFRQLERDLRNAAIVSITDNGNLMVLDTRIASSSVDDAWICVGYYVDATSGTLRRVQGTPGTLTTAVALSKTSDAEISAATAGWPVQYAGFTAIGSSRPFGAADGEYNYPVIPGIPILLSSDTGDHKPVELRKTISLRPQDGSAGSCI